MAIEDLREIGNVLYERRSDGMLYPVRRVRPDTEARGVPVQDPSLLNVGGIGQRLGLLNQFFNPVEAIGQSMNAGERMMSPNMGVMDRVAALGDMLSGVAGVTGPAVVAGRAGVPAAAAVMEGLLGGSPTTQAAGDTMRAAGRDVVERLNQPGQMPTVYANPIPGLQLYHNSPHDFDRFSMSQIGTGDRSERIRTYNFPQNRVTDHRVDLTLYKLDKVVMGDLDEIIPALRLQARERALLQARIAAGDPAFSGLMLGSSGKP